ncbi:MAG: hypothetical protein HY791_09035 [Deltaproteobacteria bacterium]|nr:hypothetical protein [Deltaproteobacteria bacterium]
MRRAQSPRARRARWPDGPTSTLALFSMACAPEASRIVLSVEGAQAVLVVSLPEDGATRVAAFDTRSEETVSMPVADAENLFVLRYACALDDLSISPGWVEGGDRTLPRPSSLQRGESTAAAVTAWPIEELIPIRIEGPARPGPCRKWVSRGHFAFPGTAAYPIRAVVRISNERAFATTADGRFFEMTMGEAPRLLTEISTATPSLAAFRRPSGESWLAGYGGKLVRAFVDDRSPLTEVEVLETLNDQTHEGHIWLDGSDDGEPELFLLSDSSRFAQYREGHWRSHFEGDPLEDERTGAFGGVAWIGRGEALAIGPFGENVARFSTGTLELEPAPSQAPDVPKTLVRSGRRVWLGTSLGNVFERSGASWELSFSSPSGARIVTPFDRGLVAGGRDGEFVRLSSEGVCPAEPIAPSDASLALAWTDRALLVVAEGHGDEDDQGFVAELPGEDACP